MNIQKYIKNKKELYEFLIRYLEETEDSLNNFEELMLNIKNHNYLKDKIEFGFILQLILSISNNYHRTQNFFDKIHKILKYLEEDIKCTFSSYEIFNIFKDNLIITHFLFKNKIIVINSNIIQFLTEASHQRHLLFFLPEIKNFIDQEVVQTIKKDILFNDSEALNNFEEKRQVGENTSYICSLIREDSVEEFISYTTKASISLNSQIKPSIFETNSLLLNNHPTLIEYAAFFGSIKIFQYLRMNDVELTPSLWIYAIHSGNAELIHLLENNYVDPPQNTYESCLKEAIKCHQNNIANYILDNLMNKTVDDFNENIIECVFCYYNYSFFPNDFSINFGFFYLCEYNYTELVKLFIEKNEKSLATKIILKCKYFIELSKIAHDFFILNSNCFIEFLPKSI